MPDDDLTFDDAQPFVLDVQPVGTADPNSQGEETAQHVPPTLTNVLALGADDDERNQERGGPPRSASPLSTSSSFSTSSHTLNAHGEERDPSGGKWDRKSRDTNDEGDGDDNCETTVLAEATRAGIVCGGESEERAAATSASGGYRHSGVPAAAAVAGALGNKGDEGRSPPPPVALASAARRPDGGDGGDAGETGPAHRSGSPLLCKETAAVPPIAVVGSPGGPGGWSTAVDPTPTRAAAPPADPTLRSMMLRRVSQPQVPIISVFAKTPSSRRKSSSPRLASIVPLSKARSWQDNLNCRGGGGGSDPGDDALASAADHSGLGLVAGGVPCQRAQRSCARHVRRARRGVSVVVHSIVFELFILSLIVLNGVTIGVETARNLPDAAKRTIRIMNQVNCNNNNERFINGEEGRVVACVTRGRGGCGPLDILACNTAG